MSGSPGYKTITRRKIATFAMAILVVTFMVSLTFFAMTAPGWTKEKVLPAWTQSEHDLAIDSRDRPCIAAVAVYGGALSLVFAKKVAGDWEVAHIVNTSGDRGGCSLALDQRDNAYICSGIRTLPSTDSSQLLFATNREGAWSVETIDLGYDYYSSGIAVDSVGRAHILCSGSKLDGTYRGIYDTVHIRESRLEHFVEAGDGWERSEITGRPVENYTTLIQSFEIDANDVMHFLVRNWAYRGESYSDIEETSYSYGTTTSGEWAMETILRTNYTEGTRVSMSMAIDANGKAHLAAPLWDNGTQTYRMSYLNNVDGDWSSTAVAYAGNGWPSSNSIAIDSEGAVHIAYYSIYYSGTAESYNHTERYVTNSGGTWRHAVIDDKRGWDDTENIRIALTSGNRVLVSYFCNLGEEGKGDRYFIRFATPGDIWTTVGNSAPFAALVTMLASPIVAVGALVYTRLKRSPPLIPDDGSNRPGSDGPLPPR